MHISNSVQFCAVQPTVFRLGDIVETQMTVAMVPVTGRRFKLVFQLRTLALVDSTFAQVFVISSQTVTRRTDSHIKEGKRTQCIGWPSTYPDDSQTESWIQYDRERWN
jgi:hypothetical protein